MNIEKIKSLDEFPKQGTCLHKKVNVCFNYDASKSVKGVCIRDDDAEPFLTIFALENGRVVLAVECQYQPA